MNGRTVATALVLAMTVAPAARAADAPVTSADAAAAQVLFDAARKLMAEGRYAEACPKLEESQRLDAGWGTVINLADCTEHLGRTATAWSLYLDVASGAGQAGQAKRAEFARARAAALDSQLSRVTITVASQAPPDLEIKRDGVRVGRAQWDMAVPVDPGEHVVEAAARGRRAWRLARVVAPGEQVRIEVPALLPGAVALVVPDPPRTRSIAGLALGAAGVAALGVAAVFAAKALDHKHRSDEDCHQDFCGAAGAAERRAAVSDGNRATLLAVGGLAALIPGVVLYLTGRTHRESSLAFSPALTGEAVGWTAGGRF